MYVGVHGQGENRKREKKIDKQIEKDFCRSNLFVFARGSTEDQQAFQRLGSRRQQMPAIQTLPTLPQRRKIPCRSKNLEKLFW